MDTKSSKLSKTIDDQIEILESRGMIFDFDNDKVKDILKDIGYYRLGFYWRIFDLKYDESSSESDHKFKEGTLFSTVVQLYYLNYELRILLLRYLHRTEVNFRTKLTYKLSRKYKDNPLWYCDLNVVKDAYRKKLENKIYVNIKNRNKPIRNHHTNYPDDDYAPCWKTIEFFDFGQTLELFESLKYDNDRLMFIQDFPEFRKTNHFRTAIRSLIELRNACSHGQVLFDYKGNYTLPYIEDLNYNEAVPKNFDSHLRLLYYFVGKISVNRQNEMRQKINTLFKDFSTKSKEIERVIRFEMGYLYFE